MHIHTCIQYTCTNADRQMHGTPNMPSFHFVHVWMPLFSKKQTHFLVPVFTVIVTHLNLNFNYFLIFLAPGTHFETFLRTFSHSGGIAPLNGQRDPKGLGENSLTGAVPDCFRSCKHLEGLLLDNNMLEGALPSSLTQLRRLSHLDLSAGQAQRGVRRVYLQGCIPDLSCPLWENQLYKGGPLLLLHGQMFEGRLGHMSSSFLVLTIHENRFEGMPAIVNCRNGARVTVHRNWLSCGIPTLKCGSGEGLDLSLVAIGNSFFIPKDRDL